MAEKILIFIHDRLIKATVLKCLYERNLEFMEVLDENDLILKLDIFKETILFCMIQIKPETYEEQYRMVKELKQGTGSLKIPVMAIIPDGSVEYVGGAKKVGIEDVLLIPEKRELFERIFITRFDNFLKKIPGNKPHPDIDEIRRNILSALSSNEDLIREVKRSGRGKYPISLVMGRIAGIHIGMIQDFYEKLGKTLRDTDRIINYDYRIFVVACPFTEKKFLVEVENKIREVFEGLFGGYTRRKKLDMYGVTYPDDGKNLEKLVEILEKGVHDSIIISSIREPLNTLSRERLEEYRKMLRLYK